jgi:hypothetical protein
VDTDTDTDKDIDMDMDMDMDTDMDTDMDLEVHNVLVSFQVAVGIISFWTQTALPVPEFSAHKSPVAIDGPGIVLRCF